MSSVIRTNGFILLFLFPFCTFAQTEMPQDHDSDSPWSVLRESWRWRHFTTDDGLPGNVVVDVLESNEIVWAQTHAGIAWYDGFGWVHVTKGLPAESFFCSASDEQGTIYLGGMSGIYRGNRDGFEKIRLPAPYENASVQSVGSDGQYAYIVAESQSDPWQVMKINGEEIELIEVTEEIQNSRSAALLGTESRRIWLSVETGVFVLQGDSWKQVFKPEQIPSQIARLFDNRNGVAIASFHKPETSIGIWEWTPETTPIKNEGEGYGILRSAAVAPNGDAIAVYDTGELRIRSQGEWSRLPQVPEALRYALEIKIRPNGDIWVCSKRGLFLLRESMPRWRHWRDPAVNSRKNRVNDLVSGPNGAIWVATNGGIAKLDNQSLQDSIPQLSDAPHAFNSIAFDNDHALWAGSKSSFKGLRKWDGKQWNVITQSRGGGEIGHIDKIRKDRHGRLWFLTYSITNGESPECCVHRLEGDEVVAWKPIESSGISRTREIFEDGRGRIWVGTRKGVSRWDGEKWDHWKVGSDFSGPTNAIIAHPDGGVWVARNMARLTHVDEFGLSERVNRAVFDIWDVAYANDGALWASGNRGLYRYSDGVWSSFDPASDMGVTWLSSVLPMADAILVGSVGAGVYSLNLAESESPPPKIELKKPVVDQGRVHLQWLAKAWWGELPALDIETRVRIDDQPWTKWRRTRALTLDDMSSGKHSVTVEAKGLFGAVSSETVDFYVSRPFYNSPFFITPIVALTIAFVALTILHNVLRYRGEKALRKSESEHRLLMEQAYDAIFIIDCDDRIAKANPRAVELVDYAAEELIGEFATSIFVDSESMEGTMLSDIVNGAGVFELSIRRKEGDMVRVEVSAKRLPDGRIQAIVRDVTERKQQEDSRREFERQIVESQKLESMGLMAGGAAHDFNNLLMVILASAEQAAFLASDNKQLQATIDRIYDAVMNARGLTQQLLAYAGRGTIKTGQRDLSKQIHEMKNVLDVAVGANTQLRYSLDEDVPLIEFDENGLRQVILNLVVNASEALQGENGLVQVETGTAIFGDGTLEPGQWRELATGQWVFLRVSDDGVGMDKKTADKIFDPFFTTKFTGRGLGLAAVQGILRAHQGHVFVKTSPSRGSVFTVMLPAKSSTVDQPQPAENVSIASSGKVLIVDDEPLVLQLTNEMLQRLGYESIPTTGGREACNALENMLSQLQAVVVDVTMPGIDGVDVYKYLRQRDRYMPVLFISGYSEYATEEICRGDQFARFLQKPFSLQTLDETLQELLMIESASD